MRLENSKSLAHCVWFVCALDAVLVSRRLKLGMNIATYPPVKDGVRMSNNM